MARARADDKDLVVPAAERARYEASFARFASVFPDVFYVSERGRYFPDDSDDKGRFLSAGYHNVMGFWRDDVPLMELVLDEKGQKELNRLWDEFDFIADHTARTWAQFYFNQSGAVDGKGAEAGRPRPTDKAIDDPDVIFGLRNDYRAKAAADPANDPVAVEAVDTTSGGSTARCGAFNRCGWMPSRATWMRVLRFAARAYRRPLTQDERDGLLAYYRSIRKQDGLSHEDAVRDLIVSVLISPKFCYRLDLLVPRRRTRHHRAARLAPSRRLRAVVRVRAGEPLELFPVGEHARRRAARDSRHDLHKKDVLLAQARRMLKDPKARGLALEFGGNWLDFRRFKQHNAVDRERFPAFTNELREAMFQEPVRLIEDMIRNDRSVLDLIYGNYTFVNPVLARHYGMPVPAGDENHWVRVDEAAKYGRGGLLHDGRVPDAERAWPAHQPGQARLLGRAARAGRDDSATAARRPGTAEGRSRSWIGRCATCSRSTARIRSAPPAMRASIRSALRSRTTGRSASAATRISPDAAVDTQAMLPGGVQASGFAGVQDVHPAASSERLRGQSQPQAAGRMR